MRGRIFTTGFFPVYVSDFQFLRSEAAELADECGDAQCAGRSKVRPDQIDFEIFRRPHEHMPAVKAYALLICAVKRRARLKL